jgi:hypothetical protein
MYSLRVNGSAKTAVCKSYGPYQMITREQIEELFNSTREHFRQSRAQYDIDGICRIFIG